MLQGQPLHLLSANPYRCIKKGECLLRGTHSKGNLVPSRNKLHIKYLEPGPLLELYCYHSYGQHHGGCLFKGGGGGGGRSKLGPICALLWRILTWCSRKKAPARHIHASTMSRAGIHCVETQCLVIYLGLYVAFNTVQVISRQVVGRAEETSTYSWSRFCTVNCRPMASNYQLSHLR